MAGTDALLSLSDVHTYIGRYHILHGVNLEIPRGELTMLLDATAPARPPRCAR